MMNSRRALGILVLATLAPLAAAQTVALDGKRIEYSRDDEPFRYNGTVMVPIRRTAAAIGARLDIRDDNRRYDLRWRDNDVRYRRGESSYLLDGRRRNLRAGSLERRGRMFVSYELFRDLTDRRLTIREGDYWPDRPDRPDPEDRPRRGDILYDGRVLRFSGDERPVVRGGTLLVPCDKLARTLGYSSSRRDGNIVVLRGDGDEVRYEKRSRSYRLNGQRRSLRVPSEDRRDILFVPIELFQSIAGRRLRWED